jgi:hypothetical protein
MPHRANPLRATDAAVGDSLISPKHSGTRFADGLDSKVTEHQPVRTARRPPRSWRPVCLDARVRFVGAPPPTGGPFLAGTAAAVDHHCVCVGAAGRLF